MALVIELKPGEKILVGDAVITNDKNRTRLHISGSAPILREKDVLKEVDADTPCKQVYFLVQCMYLAGTSEGYNDKYFALVGEIQKASPTSSVLFMKINEHIMNDAFYKALKASDDLIDHEAELVALAQAG